jgi:hypothetical protein
MVGQKHRYSGKYQTILPYMNFHSLGFSPPLSVEQGYLLVVTLYSGGLYVQNGYEVELLGLDILLLVKLWKGAVIILLAVCWSVGAVFNNAPGSA